MAESAKKVIQSEQFEKNIEIEAQNLMYFERMSKEKAFSKARDYVSAKYQVA